MHERQINGAKVLQKPSQPDFNPSEEQLVDSMDMDDTNSILQYNKIKIHGRTIKILSSSLRTKRNDSCVAYNSYSTGGLQYISFGLVHKVLVDIKDNCALLIHPLDLFSDIGQCQLKHIVHAKKGRYALSID